MTDLHFTAVGHLTNDQLESGVAPGGSALYAALAAGAMGARARVLTSIGTDFVGAEQLEVAGVEVSSVPAARTTTFENRYVHGARRQRVLAVATPLTTPPAKADIVFACPVIGEVGAQCIPKNQAVVIGAGLQGWLRQLGHDGIVTRKRLDDVAFLEGTRVLFMSDEDLGDEASSMIPRLRAVAPIVVVTEGARGARVFVGSDVHRVVAHPASEVDPTGAGDVFATGFLVALAKGASPLDAAVVGACAASIAIEDIGPHALSRLSELESRLAYYKGHLPSPRLEASE